VSFLFDIDSFYGIDDCRLIFFRNIRKLGGKFFAVKLKKTSEWFRAKRIRNFSWRLIDDGKIILWSDIDNIIPLLPQYHSIPAFCCVMTVFTEDSSIEVSVYC
jgi:hypothetical protein